MIDRSFITLLTAHVTDMCMAEKEGENKALPLELIVGTRGFPAQVHNVYNGTIEICYCTKAEGRDSQTFKELKLARDVFTLAGVEPKRGLAIRFFPNESTIKSYDVISAEERQWLDRIYRWYDQDI